LSEEDNFVVVVVVADKIELLIVLAGLDVVVSQVIPRDSGMLLSLYEEVRFWLSQVVSKGARFK
jgi:hypothetical protein